MEATPKSPTPKSPTQMVLDYFREFGVLRETPLAYWGMQVVNFLDMTAYFSMTTVVTLFLSTEIGMNDATAGYVVGIFMSAVTVFLLFSGAISDWLGIRKSLTLTMIVKAALTLGIGAMALVPPFPGRGFVVAALFLRLAPSRAMVQTVLQAANKRFTTQASRGAGFNLWYLFMNVGAAVAGVLVDAFRVWLKLGDTWVILFGALTSILCLLAAWLLVRSEAQAYGPGEVPAAETERTQTQNPLRILGSVVKEAAFWRFLVLMASVLGVRAVYLYMYLLMPKYWVRIMGPDAKIGLLTAINPVLIVIGLVLVIPIANKFNVFKMLVFGAVVSALSLFVLVVPWRLYSSDMVTAYYLMAIVSMVVLSIGEVFWSPKLYEYTAAIAPKGQEGTYLGFSMMPWFVAKVTVSFLSGHMLTRWAPEGIGARIKAGTVPFWSSPEAMWLILGVWAMAGPLLAILFRDWLTMGVRWTSGKEAEPAAAQEATA